MAVFVLQNERVADIRYLDFAKAFDKVIPNVCE